MHATLYSQQFFDQQSAGSLTSARAVLRELFDVAPIGSVVDVGCGVAPWLRTALEFGVNRAVGLDGDYVDRARLLVEPARFRPCDLEAENLRQAIADDEPFALAMCMEVAEHLSPGRARSFVAELCGLSDLVLFSAAVPGQGGLNHINEQVRLYSISSSLAACPNSVHLTVATVQYESFGRMRQGVASGWMAGRVDESTPIPCFITPNNKFRLPAPDQDVPIIMVGPGTGVAPFRAFVQERRVTGAQGRAWLFFGEQHQSSEFFYEDEWNAALGDGSLTKLTTAFSRDQAHKIYVQHRMIEEGAQLWQWLDEGGIFYVCGDKTRMAADVDAALHEVIHQHGGKTPEEAAQYVEAMKKEHRYHRDVY